MKKHFVTFFGPGTFVSEAETKEVKSWNVDDAIQMAADVVMRYGARPYAFQFWTKARGHDEFDSKEVERGPLCYLGGHLETLADVEKRNDPKEEILRSNMRINKIKQIIVNTNSWRFTGEFKDGDILLDVTLPPLKKTA